MRARVEQGLLPSSRIQNTNTGRSTARPIAAALSQLNCGDTQQKGHLNSNSLLWVVSGIGFQNNPNIKNILENRS